LGVPLQNQDRLDVLLGPGVTVFETIRHAFGYTYDYCDIWTHPACIYLCTDKVQECYISNFKCITSKSEYFWVES